MRISQKLRLNSLVVLVLVVLNAFVAIFFVQLMIGDAQQLVEVQEALDEAQMEMEINVGETARAVLHYVWTPEEGDIERKRDSEQDFERYAKDFERLAEGQEVEVLGRKVTELFEHFKALGDEITSISDRRNDGLLAFRENAAEISRLINEKLQPAIDQSGPEALTKIDGAINMELSIDKSFAAIEGYLLKRDPVLRKMVTDSEADFKRFVAQYRGTRLSAPEGESLDQLDKDFVEALAAGREIIALTDRLHDTLESFEADLEEIDRLLDEEIQVRIMRNIARATEGVRRSGAIAIYSVVAVGLLIFAIVSGVGWLVSRGIAAATDRLGEGAAQFARGNLDHRIDSRSEDELGALAAAFNDMADKRMQADKELKLYSESLEEMVEERTKELGDAQEELVRKEKLSVLGQLAGGVGHELRNPLGVISNAVYYLKMVLPDADDNVKEYLETISTEVDCSTEIISDLLDLSRTRPAQREKVEIFELINQALDKHRSPEEVELTTKIASDLPPVYVDSRQIGQVLHNLVTNAYQAMPEGGKLTISARAEKGRVILSITDTGCGISQENIKKLFEPLFTTRANGIGLGLTVCKNLVETNGGSIEVESKGGKGSTFILLLPINEGVSS